MSEYDNRRYQRQAETSDPISVPGAGRRQAARRGAASVGGASAGSLRSAGSFGNEVRISGVPQSAVRSQAQNRAGGNVRYASSGSAGQARTRNSSRTRRPEQITGRSSQGGAGQDPRARARAAARRRRRRQRRRMIRLLAAVLFLAVVIGGIFLFRGHQKTKQIEAYKQEGITAAESGDYASAVTAFDRALEVAGTSGSAQTDIRERRAQAQYDAKDYEASLESWKALLETDKNNDDYKKNTVLCMIELGQYDEALTYGVLQSKIYNKMAVEKIRTGDYEGALNDIDRGLIVDDGTAEADLVYNQAVAYENQGEYEKALTQFEDYISRFGEDENVQKEIDWLKQQMGESGGQTQETQAEEGETQAAE